MTHMPGDHAFLGNPMNDISNLKTIFMTIVANTGCQSTIIPLRSANYIGITKRDLIPGKERKGKTLVYLDQSWLMLQPQTLHNGLAKSTRLLCYYMCLMPWKELFFNWREALTSLGIIHTNFPNLQLAPHLTLLLPLTFMKTIETCSCPRRQPKPPPVPTDLPPGLKRQQRSILIIWGSGFWTTVRQQHLNVSEHQSLSLMNC